MSELTAKDLSTLVGTAYRPDLRAIFSRWGLYDRISDGWDGVGGLHRWLWGVAGAENKVDLFCPLCAAPSVFTHDEENRLHRPSSAGSELILEVNKKVAILVPISMIFRCARDAEHIATLALLVTSNSSVEKTGQYPSIADLAERQLDVYKKVLGVERLRELKKGVGLFAHGIGIGSLIYLRRTFEFIVTNAEKEATANGDALPYDQNARMADKIKALAAFLPDFIVEERTLYGLLSDGIHNRSEDQCKAMFSPCLDGIKIALDHLEAERAKVERSRKAKADLAAVADMLKEIEAEESKKEH